jgi:LPS export ABC transporter protein LptC
MRAARRAAAAGLCAGLLLVGLISCRRAPESRGGRPGLSVPEQTVRDFAVESFAQGQKDWVLRSPHADLFEASHRIDVQAPKIQFFEKGEPSSNVEAGQGRINTETKDLWVWENVVMTSTDGVRLVSDHLRYDREQDRVVSTAPVTITKGGSVTRGVGWEARPDLSEIVIRRQRVEIAPEDVPGKEEKPGESHDAP